MKYTIKINNEIIKEDIKRKDILITIQRFEENNDTRFLLSENVISNIISRPHLVNKHIRDKITISKKKNKC